MTRWLPEYARPKAPTVPTFVYFIREGDDGPIKIGWAVDPEARRRDLGPGNHRKLNLLGYLPGDKATETIFHRRFIAWNVGGEWFSADAPGLLDLAESASLVARAIEDGSDAISGALAQRIMDALRLDEGNEA